MASFTFDPADRSEAGAALAVILAIHPDLLTLTRRSDARVVEQPAAPDAAGASSPTAAASSQATVSSSSPGSPGADGGGPLSSAAPGVARQSLVESGADGGPLPVTDAPVTPSSAGEGAETSREAVAGPRRKSPRKKTEPPPAPASVEMPPEASDLDW